MLVDKGVFVLSLILESQSFDTQVSKTTKLIFAWFTFKRVVCLRSFPIWFNSLFWGTEECPIIVLIVYFWSLSSSSCKIFLLDITNIKIISHLNVSSQRCVCLVFDFRVSKFWFTSVWNDQAYICLIHF